MAVLNWVVVCDRVPASASAAARRQSVTQSADVDLASGGPLVVSSGMTGAVAALLLAVATAVLPLSGAELPKSDDDEVFDVEPPVLIPNRDRDSSTEENVSTAAKPTDPDRLQKELDRATKNAEGAERLYKTGVLAKAEVEQRQLRVIRLQSDLAAARLEALQEEMRLQEAQVAEGEIAKEELAKTQHSLAEAAQAADAAAAKRERAELEAAEINLRRQQKLAQFGIGRKSELVRAQEKLEELKGAKN